MKKSNIFFLLLVIGVILNACNYDFIVKEELPPIDPTVQVSFTTDIVPIFSQCTSCHKAGGQAPDLASANAFSSITAMNLVNTATPASSILYVYPLAGTTTHTWKKYSGAQAQQILTWIQQGAKNN